MTTPYDLGSVFDQHVAAEFQDKSVDATMDTMVEEPYVWHVPVLTGGAGREAVQGVRPRLYEVREVVGDESYSLYSSRSFLDATDLAFAVLHEWEPKEIHVVCIAQDSDEELCWKYPAPG